MLQAMDSLQWISLRKDFFMNNTVKTPNNGFCKGFIYKESICAGSKQGILYKGFFSAGDLWYPKLLLSNRSALNKSSHLFHLRISDTHTTNYDHEYQDIYGVFHPANQYIFEIPKIDTYISRHSRTYAAHTQLQ